MAGVAGAIAMGRAYAEGAAPVPQDQEQADMSPEQRMLGYWAPDWEAISAHENWKAMIKGLAELGLRDRSEEGIAQAEKEVMEELKEYCRIVTMEHTKDKILKHTGPGQVEEQGYVVKKVDAKAGTIDVELVSSFGDDPEPGRFIINGDHLTFTGLPEKESAPWILNRIDKATFEKRQAAAAESKLIKEANQNPQFAPPPEGGEPKDPGDAGL